MKKCTKQGITNTKSYYMHYFPNTLYQMTPYFVGKKKKNLPFTFISLVALFFNKKIVTNVSHDPRIQYLFVIFFNESSYNIYTYIIMSLIFLFKAIIKYI